MEPYKVEIADRIFTIDRLRQDDIRHLSRVLMQWVMWQGEILWTEVDSTMESFSQSILHMNDHHYIVLRDSEGKAIGVSGIKEPEEAMGLYTEPDVKTGEMIHVFLNNDSRGKGLGRVMFEAMKEMARELGYQQMIWNSGPRYQNTAWDFYTHIAGDPIATAQDYYGEGRNAPVWRVSL